MVNDEIVLSQTKPTWEELCDLINDEAYWQAESTYFQPQSDDLWEEYELQQAELAKMIAEMQLAEESLISGI